MGLALAIVLGAVLLAGILDPLTGSPLVTAGGGTFGRSTQHVDGRRGEPVGRWTHLAMTYDGATHRLYVDGVPTSSRLVSGPIRRTTDPCGSAGPVRTASSSKAWWTRRVLRPSAEPSRCAGAASTPIGSRDAASRAGLGAAYGFESRAGRSVIDASGNGNTGAIRGAAEPRVKQAQLDTGTRNGLASDAREALRQLRRENARLKQERDIHNETSSPPAGHGVWALTMTGSRCARSHRAAATVPCLPMARETLSMLAGS